MAKRYCVAAEAGVGKMTEKRYLNKVHRQFGANPQNKKLFTRVAAASSGQREQILKDVQELIRSRGAAYGLLALYRQQVNCGFVLADPLKTEGKEINRFKDKTTGISFRILWNPDRELRKNHKLLIERGVIAEDIDKSKLINLDEKGKPCYLCRENIAIQNPAEILFGLRLGGEDYYTGANFAYIENNHFTIMSGQHRDQKYGRHILAALNDFIEQTDGHFRAIFNGLAGASITSHEHLQATTEEFPVENIRIRKNDVIFQKDSLRIIRPFYYIPLWIVEGNDREEVINAADSIIVRWERLNPKFYTENIIVVKTDGLFRMFIFLRDTRCLAGEGKFGDMASFECGGDIVLSYEPQSGEIQKINERKTFDTADINVVRALLGDVAPIIPDAVF